MNKKVKNDKKLLEQLEETLNELKSSNFFGGSHYVQSLVNDIDKNYAELKIIFRYYEEMHNN